MDSDFIIFVVVFVFWLLSSLAVRVGKAMKQRSEQAPAAAGGEQSENAFQRALRELAEQMSVEVEIAPAEPPVASEHRRTASEHDHTPGWHDRAASEVRRTASEHGHTPGWHDRTASEVGRTASEVALAASEHELTGPEHRRGDVRGTPIVTLDAARKRPRSRLAKRLHADLTGGPRSLARAVLLREILGPPVGLRSPGQDRGG